MASATDQEEQVRNRAATMIAGRYRGKRARAQLFLLKGQRELERAQARAGWLEKRSARRSYVRGQRQVVLWQRRYARIEDSHFVYSKSAPLVKSIGTARGGEKRLHLSVVTDVLAVNGVPEFVLVTAERSLHFHSQTIVETQGWINAISLLQAFLREQTHAAATIVTREGR